MFWPVRRRVGDHEEGIREPGRHDHCEKKPEDGEYHEDGAPQGEAEDHAAKDGGSHRGHHHNG